MRDSFRLGFSNQIVGLPGVRTTELTSERDVWAIGRHHGLVTPVLDWTRSPFVACFFACFDHLDHYNPGFREGARGFGAGVNVSPTHPVAVWELAHDDETQVSAEFEIFESRIDQAHRQRAQQGVFTMLTHHTALDLESYLVTRDLGLRLARYEIPGSEVGKALWNLRLMNITYGTLYPDLDGAAIEANTAQHIRPFSFHYRPDS